jgi:CheY-like chemotaxis protein
MLYEPEVTMSHNGVSFVRPGQAARAAARDFISQTREILVVEDDPAITSSLTETLLEEGFEVGAAANGREALERLRSGLRPAAIILDLMMPVMDGWDFRSEQLKDPALRDIPVVVVTAAGFSHDTIRTQFGDVGLVPKPVPLSDLLDALGRACNLTPSAA